MDTLEIPNRDNLPKDPEDHDVEKCKVCAHKNRRTIEKLYALGWNVWTLAKQYSIRQSNLKKHLEWSSVTEKDETGEARRIRQGQSKIIMKH